MMKTNKKNYQRPLRKETFNSHSWYELPYKVQLDIHKGKKELDEGKGIPHEEVMKELHG